MELFKILYKNLGAEIMPFIADIPAPVMKTLSAEFEKI